jgi:hypothetical protein
LWRCGDGLFFEGPALASDALLATLHPLLENVLQTFDHFEISCLGAPFSWLEKPRNCMGRDLDCMPETNPKVDRWNVITSSIQSRFRPIRFLGLSHHEKGVPRQENTCSTILLKLAANGLQHVFEKWVEPCKGIACQGRYFEKETVTAPTQSSDSE